jgi:hypothetical protein
MWYCTGVSVSSESFLSAGLPYQIALVEDHPACSGRLRRIPVLFDLT